MVQHNNGVRKSLSLLREAVKRPLTMESLYIDDEYPEGSDLDGAEGDASGDAVKDAGTTPTATAGDLSNIDKDLAQIRKIALNAIARLADQPTSASYDTMKRIWNLVDKFSERSKEEPAI